MSRGFIPISLHISSISPLLYQGTRRGGWPAAIKNESEVAGARCGRHRESAQCYMNSYKANRKPLRVMRALHPSSSHGKMDAHLLV